LVQGRLPVVCTAAHKSASVALARSEMTNKSARIRRKGEFPSAATSARMKNQNQ
jgi:hypothetical protein